MSRPNIQNYQPSNQQTTQPIHNQSNPYRNVPVQQLISTPFMTPDTNVMFVEKGNGCENVFLQRELRIPVKGIDAMHPTYFNQNTTIRGSVQLAPR